MQTRELYVSLFLKKYQSSDQFIDKLINPNHIFYGASREFAAEILKKEDEWKWLGNRIDDIGYDVEKMVSKKIQRWKFRAVLGTGKMPMCDLQTTATWLMNRMVNEYKNLFDKKTKNYLDIKKSDDLIKIKALKMVMRETGGENE